jgi:carbon monoxide dehydrogenase subunit G
VRDRDVYVVQATMHVEVPPALAWRVLTDYADMPRFMPDLLESRATTPTVGDTVHVYQRGQLRIGPFSQAWEAERAVLLVPETSITSHLLRGNMKRLDMETHLLPDGSGTRIDYRSTMQPDFWVPPLIGPAMMKRQVVRQLDALLAEMLRRTRSAPLPPTTSTSPTSPTTSAPAAPAR